MQQIMTVGITMVAIIVVLVGVSKFAQFLSCDNQWTDYEHRFQFYGGCMVKNKEGKWIPAANFRNIED